MSQVASGLRSVLANARVYSLLRRLVLDEPRHARFVAEHVRARSGDRVLDVGCGPADVLDQLPRGVRYEGFDASDAYIARARSRFGDRGAFRCARVDQATVDAGAFDVVLAIGVVHHLSDDETRALHRLARHALKAGGRLVTIDPCYADGQSRIARFLIDRDRGRHVRDRPRYESLARETFDDVRATMRTDLLRVPYTHLILECRKPE